MLLFEGIHQHKVENKEKVDIGRKRSVESQSNQLVLFVAVAML